MYLASISLSPALLLLRSRLTPPRVSGAFRRRRERVSFRRRHGPRGQADGCLAGIPVAAASVQGKQTDGVWYFCSPIGHLYDCPRGHLYDYPRGLQ